VGIALGVMVTFALARGVLPLPWQSSAPVERNAPARASMHEWQDYELDTRTSLLSPGDGDRIEPRRPARPSAVAATTRPSTASRS
jgi:hypothetical protein